MHNAQLLCELALAAHIHAYTVGRSRGDSLTQQRYRGVKQQRTTGKQPATKRTMCASQLANQRNESGDAMVRTERTEYAVVRVMMCAVGLGLHVNK